MNPGRPKPSLSVFLMLNVMSLATLVISFPVTGWLNVLIIVISITLLLASYYTVFVVVGNLASISNANYDYAQRCRDRLDKVVDIKAKHTSENQSSSLVLNAITASVQNAVMLGKHDEAMRVLAEWKHAQEVGQVQTLIKLNSLTGSNFSA